MEKQTYRLVHDLARARAAQAVLAAPDSYIVTISPERRTEEQNRLLWPLLRDVATQIRLHDEYLLTEHEWKDVFTASLDKETKVVPNLDRSGFIILRGKSTSRMNKKDFSSLIELIYAYGSEHLVTWSTDATSIYNDYRRAA